MQIGLRQAGMAQLSFKSKEKEESPKKQELIKGIKSHLAKAGITGINIPEIADMLLETEKRIDNDRESIPARINSLDKRFKN